jgi:hypothetical protein
MTTSVPAERPVEQGNGSDAGVRVSVKRVRKAFILVVGQSQRPFRQAVTAE